MKCKICDKETRFFAKETILKKYAVSYFECGSCGFVCTEEPYWLEESYADAITQTDLGLAGRNISLARTVKALVLSFFDANASFVDYGGGYGLLVRILRDAGLEFVLHEQYAPNLFAKGFTANEPDTDQEQKAFELLTTFEVLEHLTDPLQELRRMLRFSNNILFTTELLPPSRPKPGEWWYYGLEHGQHISFFTEDSLRSLSETLGLRFYSDGNALHLFTDQKLSPFAFGFVTRKKVICLLNALWRRKSLLEGDHQQALHELNL